MASPNRLTYVTDEMPGIARLRRGKGFAYRGPDGRGLNDKAQIERIRRLAIPPAYTKVWICPLPQGHLQATGRDARGRKQYRYHPEWRQARESDKFGRMAEFGAALPRIRTRVKKDLAASPASAPPDRAAVLATLVRLLDTTLIRIGNEEYARSNGSFGLTTLKRRHVEVKGSRLRLHFKGKSGVMHDVAIEDPRVARIVQNCQAMPGQELFQYEDEDGVTRCVGSADVNDYLREISGGDFTAKDFRTWHASVLALDLLCREEAAERSTPACVKRVVADVAARLRNTVAVCRKSYIHPRVLEATWEAQHDARLRPRRGLSIAERRLLAFLSHTTKSST
jgi:DNA topoisomerase I